MTMILLKATMVMMSGQRTQLNVSGLAHFNSVFLVCVEFYCRSIENWHSFIDFTFKYAFISMADRSVCPFCFVVLIGVFLSLFILG